MKKTMILALGLLFATTFANAQILSPVKWSYGAKKTGANTAVVFLRATIDAGWHIYSLNIKDGGPIKTSFTFSPSAEYTLAGTTIEPTPITKFEKAFGMDVSYFEHDVIFQQKIKLKNGQAVVKGKLEYMTCNDQKCLPPDDIDFSIPVK